MSCKVFIAVERCKKKEFDSTCTLSSAFCKENNSRHAQGGVAQHIFSRKCVPSRRVVNLLMIWSARVLSSPPSLLDNPADTA